MSVIMLTNDTFRLLYNREAARNNPFRAIVGGKAGYKTRDINLPSCFLTFSPVLFFFIVHLKGDPIIWFSIIWPDYKSTDMMLWVCFSVLRVHVLWLCDCAFRYPPPPLPPLYLSPLASLHGFGDSDCYQGFISLILVQHWSPARI